MVFEHTTSTGQHATDATWLDVHFEAEQENYVNIVRSVGIEPGWHVFDAGLEDVRQWTVNSEFNAPLVSVYHQFVGNLINNMSQARLADDPNLSDEARAWLENQIDPDSEAALVNHPRFSYCGGHVVTTGRVPES